MHEPLDPDRKPFRFITPSDAYQPCAVDENRFTWPSAAVVVPQADHRDRVLIFFQSLCASGQGMTSDIFHAMGVAEYWYDPAHVPGPDEPIQATILEEQLFEKPTDADSSYGQAAVLHDGYIYVYRCLANGTCSVGRIEPAGVTHPDHYRFWDGSTWAAGADHASSMDLPNHTFAIKPSVAYFPNSRLFVMADMADLHTGIIGLRVARSPQGPWSAPTYTLPPGCEHVYPHQCFGVEVHENMSDAGHIAITYYNPAIGLGESPVREVRVPVRIIPAGLASKR